MICRSVLMPAKRFDLVGFAFMELGWDSGGRFGSVTVEGWMDFREVEGVGRADVEFSWGNRRRRRSERSRLGRVSPSR